MPTLSNIVQIVRVHGALFALEGREVRRDALTVLFSFFIVIFASFGIWLTLNGAVVWLLWSRPWVALMACGALNFTAVAYAWWISVRILGKERFVATRREASQSLTAVLETL